MRYVFIDLSSDNYLQQLRIFGGYAGEHNETVLQVKLPKRMIGIECSGYRFDFQTSEDNKISTPLIPISELNDDVLSFKLTEQLTITGKLLFNIVAILSDENTISLIAKTSTVVLHIEGSPEGNVQLIDPNSYKDEMLKMIDERILQINPINVDTTYNPESENAQSGKAVAEAISKISTGDSEASGVHVGAEEPTDDNINVWIDIDEEADIISTEVTEIENGHRVSITDTNGTKSFDVLNGDNGYTPVKGVDYWTDEDVESINSNAETFIIDELAKMGQLKPEFANSIDECIDTSKLYVLPDGFIYAYMSAASIEYKNAVETAQEYASTNPYNDVGYYDGKYLASGTTDTASDSVDTNYTAVGFIPYEKKDGTYPDIYVKGLDWLAEAHSRLQMFDSSKAFAKHDNVNIAITGNATTNTIERFFTKKIVESGYWKLTPNDTLNGVSGISFMRISLKGKGSNLVISIGNPIEETTGYRWMSTGHAFVPAYYEDRIVSLENRIDELSHSNNTTFTYITGEAKRVADIVKEKQTVGSLTFAAMSDMHIRSSNDSYWADNITSCRDAGFGLTELQRFLKLDYAAMLGDYTVGGANDTIAQVKKDISYVKNCITNGTKEIPTIWCTGNHDINYGANTDRRMTEDEMYAYVTGNNKGTVQDCDNVGRNYGYIDFENQRVRCIYLNTVDALDYPDNTDGTADDAMEITAIQAQWLVDVGLNLINKNESTKWGIIVLSHHCLSQFQPITTILTAYKDGINGSVDVTTNGVTTTVNYDFTSANRGEIICAVHGHDHNFTYRKISAERWDKITEENAWLWSICIPNMDITRNNEKATNSEVAYAQAFGEFDVNGNPVYYPKTQRTAKSTSFCVITIDRKNRKIYVAAYGAGYDREINY